MITKLDHICCGNLKLGLCCYSWMLYCCTSHMGTV